MQGLLERQEQDEKEEQKDGGISHARCAECYPDVHQPFVALCGSPRDGGVVKTKMRCVVCKDLLHTPCPLHPE